MEGSLPSIPDGLPSPVPAPDPAEATLEAALGLLRHDWVHAFIFPSETGTFIDQLHHALSQQAAITAEINFATLQAVGLCDDRYAVDERLRLVSLPSFSTGSLTTGFEITERLKWVSPFPVRNKRFISRYVRDDENGVFVIVAEHANLGITELTVCSQISPGCRSQIYTVVRTGEFRRAIGTLRAGYDRDAIQASMLLAYFSVDMRTCPSCGSESVALCGCKLAVRRKAHPLDHEGEFKNLSTYTGGYEGLAKMRLFQPGRDSRVANFVSSVSAVFTKDYETRRRLSTWALHDLVQGFPMNIGSMQVPRAEEHSKKCTQYLIQGPPQDMLGTPEDDGSHQTANVDFAEETDMGLTWSVSNDTTPELFGEPQDFNYGIQSECFDGGSIGVPAEGTEETGAVSVTSKTTSISGVSLSSGEKSPLLRQENPAQSVKGSGRHRSKCVPEHGPFPVPAIPTSAESAVKAALASVHPSMGVNLRDSHFGFVVAPAPNPTAESILKRKVIRGPLRLAPAPKPELGDNANVNVEVPTEILRTKDEVRRARNRASAQRSNEKKRREIQRLRDDLFQLGKKAAHLREMENKLREENASLRRALSESETGVCLSKRLCKLC